MTYKEKITDIDYVFVEQDKIEDTDFEQIVNLLFKYLQRFISKDALERDVKYCLNNGRVLTAYYDGILIGAIVGVHTPFFDKFHIAHIAVKEGYQGKGIGTTLTKKIIPENKDASVHINLGNKGVEEFYKKIGFDSTHTRLKRMKDKESKPSD
ncbi:MAG: GNAT family N-acetyltransferase [Thermoplasmatota archaeon]